ncbi:MAG: DNA-3-methyladenine glycosylase [Bdellovibrionota bacterium]
MKKKTSFEKKLKQKTQATRKRAVSMRFKKSKALAHLTNADRTLASIIEKVGVCALKPSPEGEHLDHVMRSIIFQQLSGKAASTIHSRFKGLYRDRSPTPAELLKTPDEKLRSVGLSRQKIGYLKDLAAKVENGQVPLARIHELEDEAVIDALTQVKGVGRWTAQMFLMFRLGRSDVLPLVDLGIQKAIMKAYKLRALPNAKQIEKIGAAWRPYCTIACWYLWRSLELKEK